MEKKEFIDCLCVKLYDELGGGKIIRGDKVMKNNGVELDAITIFSIDCNIAPTIYIDGFYNRFISFEITFDEIVSEIAKMYRKESWVDKLNVEQFEEFDKIKGKIVYKIINTAYNQDTLENIPYIEFMDLSIVFYIMLSAGNDMEATVLINNSQLELWGVTKDEIYSIAKENTPNLLKCEIISMDEVIRGMLNDNLYGSIGEENESYFINCDSIDKDEIVDRIVKDVKKKSTLDMYVLTNEKKLYGAACILYDNVLEAFSRKMNSNIYIIPSSVHEVILVPEEEGISGKQITAMIQDVNKNELDPTDVLSDHVYYYNSEKKSIFK